MSTHSYFLGMLTATVLAVVLGLPAPLAAAEEDAARTAADDSRAIADDPGTGAEVLSDGGDWPMWRYGPGRGAATPDPLPDRLHLHWIRELPEPRRAWPEQFDDLGKLEFDLSYEPVAAGETLFVPSMVTDSLTAYDLATGMEKWRYFTDGPVRFAPVVWEGRIYVPADDGAIHCLDADNGELLWKFQGGPTERQVLGNERLIGMWPVRGGPVVQDGTLYFAAGIWPLEGVFLYALDLTTGSLQWWNSGTSGRMELHPHGGAYAFGGIGPQGCLAVSGDRLLVPGGRTAPALFDRHTGELLHFRHYNRNAPGGHRVYASADFYFNPKGDPAAHPEDVTRADGMPFRDPGKIRAIQNAPTLYRLEDGKALRRLDVDVVADDVLFGVQERTPIGYGSQGEVLEGWQAEPVPDLERLHLLAGNRLYGSGADGRVFAIQWDMSPTPAAELQWSVRVEGEVFTMLAARERLFVVTTRGRIYCFGPGQRQPVVHEYRPEIRAAAADAWTARAEKLLQEIGAEAGYALMFGIGSGRLLEELLVQSRLHVIAFDPDADKVQQFRERFTRAGLYGRRVAVHCGNAMSVQLPPYIARLIVSEDVEAAGYEAGQAFVQALFPWLRPYGGTAYLPLSGEEPGRFAALVEQAELEGAGCRVGEGYVLLQRPEALPGSGSWTHQFADAANTSYSAERRVHGPLGITWFGGSTNCQTLHKYDRSTVNPRVVAGRLILLGENHVVARCVYTGRTLWDVELPRVGRPAMIRGELDRSRPLSGGPTGTGYTFRAAAEDIRVIPGLMSSDETGVRPFPHLYVATADSVYVVHQDRCLRLDLDSGRQLAVFDLPPRQELAPGTAGPFIDQLKEAYAADGGLQQRWGQLAVWEDLLIVGAYPHMASPGTTGIWEATASEYLVALDRYTGEVQWVQRARYGFPINAVASAGGSTFVIDNLPAELRWQVGLDVRPEVRSLFERRGTPLPEVPEAVRQLRRLLEPEIIALDTRTGDVRWRFQQEVSGTWLGYCREHDVLLQAGQDDPQVRMLALRGQDGQELWRLSQPHYGPLALHPGLVRVILDPGTRRPEALDLRTGQTVLREHPVSGVPERWQFSRYYGCGSLNLSEHLITFRSGAAAYYDLLHGSGTVNLSGFRAACANNLIPADGVVNAPEMTRGCSCPYAHQTSLALVTMPEVELWAFNVLAAPEPGTIRQAGINLGAPGNRIASDGLLWVNYPEIPRVSAPALPIELKTLPDARWFRHHSLEFQEQKGGCRWVAASGVEGIRHLELAGMAHSSANVPDGSTMTLRLHFAEPDLLAAGERVFDIVVQGQRVLEAFDIVQRAGSPRRAIVLQLDNIRAGQDDEVNIEFIRSGESRHPPLICGVEVRVQPRE